MLDTLDIIKDLLEAQSTITAQVSTRIYAVELPADLVRDWETPESVTKTILIELAEGGEHHGSLPFADARVLIHAFASTPKAAYDLLGVVYEALDCAHDKTKQRQAVGSYYVLCPLQTSPPTHEQMTETLWNYASAPWSATIIDAT